MNDEIITSYLLGKKAGGGTPPVYQDKEVSITQNGTTTITKDSGYDALSSVELTVAVPQPSGKISITQNGTDIDVSSYATADVNVGGTTIDTIDKMNGEIKNSIDGFFDSMENIVATRTPASSNDLTLYTPNASHKDYIIWTQTGTSYTIYWLPTTLTYIDTSSSSYQLGTISMNSTGAKNIYWGNDGWSVSNYPEYKAGSQYRFGQGYYSKDGFSSLQDAIDAITSSETTYTFYSNTWVNLYQSSGGLNKMYSNFIAFESNNNYLPFNEGVEKLSNNETIQVIS